jgi:hypothetical protein
MFKGYVNFLKRPRFVIEQIGQTLTSLHRLKIFMANLDFLWKRSNVEQFFDFTTTTWTHGITQKE